MFRKGSKDLVHLSDEPKIMVDQLVEKPVANPTRMRTVQVYRYYLTV